MEAVARLADGVSLEQARGAGVTLAARLGTEFANSNKGWSFGIVPLLDDQLGYYRPALYVLFGAVGLLFVIGCLNVASLLLTRALSREREIAVRTALGAAPRQIVTQLLAESLILSVFGAAAGLLVALVALPVIVAVTPVEVPRLAEAAISGRVLSLALALVAVMTMGFGLVPGTRARAETRRQRPAVGRAWQFAWHAAPLPGTRRGGSGARLRAARQLGAAGPHRRTDDPRPAGCERRRRGAGQCAAVRRSRARSSRGRPWALSTRPSSIGCASNRVSRRPAARPSCRWSTAGAARSCGAISRRCAAKKRRRRSTTRSARATSKRWAPHCSTGGSSRRRIRRRPRPWWCSTRQPRSATFNGESPVGREMLSWSSQIGPLGTKPDLAGDCGRPPHSAAHSCRRGRGRHPERGAGHAGGTCGLFSDAAVSIRRRDDRHRRARHGHGAGGDAERAAFRLAEHPARHGGDLARSVQHPHGRAQTADDDADRVRRVGGVPGGAWGLRALLMVGRLAPARAGDSAHAGRAADLGGGRRCAPQRRARRARPGRRMGARAVCPGRAGHACSSVSRQATRHPP